MKINDLRIGNVVWGNYSGEMIVSAINPHEGMNNSELGVYLRKNKLLPSGYYRLKDVKPIKLSQEWAEKLGFNVIRGGISYDKEKLCLYFGDTILSGGKGRTYFNSWAILDYTPRYVHQLQNLYFALYGVELLVNV